jgi:UDPglucose--hexose-1-phosphate uridylyltransferase
MSDLRFDPLNNQWIAIATNRGDRPMEFVPMEQLRQQIVCPFCKGNEEETPAALAAYHADGSQLSEEDSSSWTVRVIPNRYPSFASEQSDESHAKGADANDLLETVGPFRRSLSAGIQELIIPSSKHLTSLSDLNEDELNVSFRAYRDRLLAAENNQTIKHAMLFMNCRLAAGASLGHIHSQLIGSPVLSDFVRSRMLRDLDSVERTGKSLIQSVMDWEIDQQKRVVAVTDHFCVLCPFASRFAFQVWIVPRSETFSFLTCPDAVRDELASLCRRTVARYETVQDNPAYNLLFHTPPVNHSHEHLNGSESGQRPNQSYFELFPRLTRAAGFEWGTDIWVNPVSPESAARRLRDDS